MDANTTDCSIAGGEEFPYPSLSCPFVARVPALTISELLTVSEAHVVRLVQSGDLQTQFEPAGGADWILTESFRAFIKSRQVTPGRRLVTVDPGRPELIRYHRAYAEAKGERWIYPETSSAMTSPFRYREAVLHSGAAMTLAQFDAIFGVGEPVLQQLHAEGKFVGLIDVSARGGAESPMLRAPFEVYLHYLNTIVVLGPREIAGVFPPETADGVFRELTLYLGAERSKSSSYQRN